MLLLNKGMMQYIKHPFHRNDYAHTTLMWVSIYDGPDLTEEQLNAIRGSMLASGRFNHSDIISRLGARNQLVWDGSNLTGMALTTIKSDGGPAKIIFPFSRISNVLLGRAAGKASLLHLTLYSNSSSVNTACELFFTVGLPNSGADVELDEVEVTVGKRFRLNDIVFNIENLLGEA